MKHYSTRTLAGFALHVVVNDSKDAADIYLTTPNQPTENHGRLIEGLEKAAMQYDVMKNYADTGMRNWAGEDDKVIRIGHVKAADYNSMAQGIGAVLKEFDEKVAVGGFQAGFLGKQARDSSPSRFEQIDAFLKNEVFEIGQAEKVKAKSSTQKRRSVAA